MGCVTFQDKHHTVFFRLIVGMLAGHNPPAIVKKLTQYPLGILSGKNQVGNIGTPPKSDCEHDDFCFFSHCYLFTPLYLAHVMNYTIEWGCTQKPCVVMIQEDFVNV